MSEGVWTVAEAKAAYVRGEIEIEELDERLGDLLRQEEDARTRSRAVGYLDLGSAALYRPGAIVPLAEDWTRLRRGAKDRSTELVVAAIGSCAIIIAVLMAAVLHAT